MAGTQMLQRRDTAAGWTANNRVLGAGEIGLETDTRRVKFGNGATPWNALSYINYLPLEGKAADSEKLDGFDSSDFILSTDVASAVANSKVARRTTDGRLKAATATEDDDLTTFLQTKNGGRYLGSGATFPTSGITAGDRYFHTTWASLAVYTGATLGWRQLHCASLSATNRAALPTTGLQQIHAGFEVYETDTGRLWAYRGTKWDLNGGKSPSCMVQRTAALNPLTVSAWTAISWQAVVSTDSSEPSMWQSGTPSSLFAPVAGIYLVSGNAGFAPIQSGGPSARYLGFQKNNQNATIRRMSSVSSTAGTNYEYGGSTPFILAAGDTVQMVYYTQVTGDTISLYSNEVSPRFELTYLGPN